MTRTYHYDTTYEQEAEDGTVTASVELRIYYTVTPAGGDDWNEPRYPAQAEFHGAGVEIGSTRKYRDLVPNMWDDVSLFRWAESFVDDHQAELIADAADLEQGEREAAADYHHERRREDRL
jgi:hypothetical protein